MAARNKTGRPVRTLVTLFALIAVLFGSVIAGTFITDKASFVPGRALDLVGGTQLILAPVAVDSSQRPSAESLSQAVAIIRQRVDASGVAEAEISSEASGNIVVGIPGNPSQEDLRLVSKSAKMTFRSVLREEQAAAQRPSAWLSRSYPKPPGDEIGADDATSEDATADDAAADADVAADSEATSEELVVDGDDAEAVPEEIVLDENGEIVEPTGDSAESTAPPPSVPPMDDFDSRLETGLDEALITSDHEDRYANIDCATVGSDVTGEPSDSDEVLVTCSDNMGTP
ncbi:MAG: hypothetical protein LBK72_01065, partial [Bifidobacteriaceae bacterium]|nr:hypothetical protein [Bifidobacteriaceae bacterium]